MRAERPQDVDWLACVNVPRRAFGEGVAQAVVQPVVAGEVVAAYVEELEPFSVMCSDVVPDQCVRLAAAAVLP